MVSFNNKLFVTDGSEVFRVEFAEQGVIENYKLVSIKKFASKKIRLYCNGGTYFSIHDAEKNQWHQLTEDDG